MSTQKKSLLTITALILATTATLAAMAARDADMTPIDSAAIMDGDDLMTFATEVIQDKVLKGSDGRVTVALNLSAANRPDGDKAPLQAADLAIVLDRSGSMEGRKMGDARQAVLHLMDQLGPDDRLALLTYANGVHTQAPLLPMNDTNRHRLVSAINQIRAGGGTNLGAGLQQGINLLMHPPGGSRQRKMILISDGLANQGVTEAQALGRMASAAVENRFTISTVGVGLDFNEVVMTAIADRGAGYYHFLEDPRVFAQVFETELQATRRVAASDVTIRIPLKAGVHLVGAGGYPIDSENGDAVIHPGNLLAGQKRTLYLTFQVPTQVEQEIHLGRVQVQYRHQGESRTVDASRPLSVACAADATAVMASIKKDQWADQVVQEEFNRLKEEVAADIREGNKAHAQARIHDYESRQTTINAVVESAKVAKNLAADVRALREQVNDTFAGAPAAVAEKKKQVAKSLQYDGYKLRRDRK